MNLCSLLCSFICCKFKKTKAILDLYKSATIKFNNYLYIVEYIKRMENIETLKKFLFENLKDRNIFERLSIPKLKIRKNRIIQDTSNSNYKNDDNLDKTRDNNNDNHINIRCSNDDNNDKSNDSSNCMFLYNKYYNNDSNDTDNNENSNDNINDNT